MSTSFKIGKITLTQQALAVFIIGSLVSLYGFFAMKSKRGVIISAVMFAYTCYATYVTNCLSVGNCDVLAWILVGLTTLAALTTPMRLKLLQNKSQ